uniref:Replication factor A protein 3 n=1 Tax=Spongospora subterranea TaxID=70186 RepID=A0A0H5RKH1_9EUKA|eukprot:CRZ09229.1 hypothetical protein [Spongospora subterranea]
MDVKPNMGGKPATRILGSMMANYVGETVRLIGKFNGKQPNGACSMTSADGLMVPLELGTAGDFIMGRQYIEVVGKVNHNRSITAYTASDLGDNLNLDCFKEVLTLVHSKCPDLIK